MAAARSLATTVLGIVWQSLGAASSYGITLATATVSTSSTSAPYSYTITLHNTGDTNIGTFWFGWTLTPTEYDFLPSSPTVTSLPAGWFDPITHNGVPGDGYGIEFYNYFGSPIAPGGIGTFTFTSPDSPTLLAGNAYIPGNKVTTTVVYAGFPLSDAGYQFNVSVVPEPSSLVLAGVGLCIGLLTWRRRLHVGRRPRCG